MEVSVLLWVVVEFLPREVIWEGVARQGQGPECLGVEDLAEGDGVGGGASRTAKRFASSTAPSYRMPYKVSARRARAGRAFGRQT